MSHCQWRNHDAIWEGLSGFKERASLHSRTILHWLVVPDSTMRADQEPDSAITRIRGEPTTVELLHWQDVTTEIHQAESERSRTLHQEALHGD
jgi:hypothetical protein